MSLSASDLKKKVKEWNSKEDTFIFSTTDLSSINSSRIQFRINSTELKNEIQKIIDSQKQEDDDLEPIEAFCFNQGIHCQRPMHAYLSPYWWFKVDKKELYEGSKSQFGDSIIYLLNENKFQMIEENDLAQLLSINQEGGDNKYKSNAEEEWKEVLKRYKRENKTDENHDNNDIYEILPKGEIGDEILAKFRSEKVLDSDLNSSLWSPYQLWAEKLVSLKNISEIENFKTQMFSAIEEAKSKKQQRSNDNGKDKSNNDKPLGNKPTDNFSKSAKEIEKFLLHYFQKHNIKSIKLESENLIIESNGGSTVANLQTLLTTSPELQGIDQYLQNKSGKAVSRHELEVGNNLDNTSTTSHPKNKIVLWIGCGLGGIVITAIITKILLKKKNRLKK